MFGIDHGSPPLPLYPESTGELAVILGGFRVFFVKNAFSLFSIYLRRSGSPGIDSWLIGLCSYNFLQDNFEAL